MSLSEAQKRAIANYRKKNVKYFSVAFYPDDADLYEWFKQQSNKNKLVKSLLRSKMEHEK